MSLSKPHILVIAVLLSVHECAYYPDGSTGYVGMDGKETGIMHTGPKYVHVSLLNDSHKRIKTLAFILVCFHKCQTLLENIAIEVVDRGVAKTQNSSFFFPIS